MITCCKDCKKRHRACWDSCPEYREQKAFEDAKREALQKEAYERQSLDGARIKAISRVMREGRWHK